MKQDKERNELSKSEPKPKRPKLLIAYDDDASDEPAVKRMLAKENGEWTR